jgi:predicted nucleic acid-binding protein
MIGFYDLIVGATAMERGSEVATFNKRHFGQIKGLSVIEPKSFAKDAPSFLHTMALGAA